MDEMGCVQPRVQEVSFPSLSLSTGVSMGWSTNYTEPDLLYLRCRDKHICLTGRWWSHSGNYQQFSMTRSSVGFGEWGARNSEQQTEFSWQKAQKPQWGPGTVSHKVCILQILVIELCDFCFHTLFSIDLLIFFFNCIPKQASSSGIPRESHILYFKGPISVSICHLLWRHHWITLQPRKEITGKQKFKQMEWKIKIGTLGE